MKEEKFVEFDIAADGTVKSEAFGFAGEGCHSAMEAYSKAIGIAVDTKKKEEYYLKEKVKEKIGKVKA